MLIVTGSVTARADTFERLLEESVAHVHRSRGETGCILHSVQADCDNPLRLFFYEQWTDAQALRTHFDQPGSREFIAAVRQLAVASEPAAIFQAEAIPRP